MVSARRKRSKTKKLLGSHQRCWLWGRHVVLETLRAGRWKPLELRLAERPGAKTRTEADSARHAEDLAREAGIAVIKEDYDALTRRCGSTEHQGFITQMPPFPWRNADELLPQLGPSSFVLILDSLQDPYNFGAILRSAEIFSADAVIVGLVRQSDVTALVARASAGAVNYVSMARSADLVATVRSLQASGFSVVGASEKVAAPLSKHRFRTPTALVIGNEGTGISPLLLDVCDARISIPQSGRIGSLNAAVAAGILAYEVRRQHPRE